MPLKLFCECGRKRTARRPTCDKCWDKKYRIKAVAFPVLTPLGTVDGRGNIVLPSGRDARIDLCRQFRQEVVQALEEATDLANWAVRQILNVDAVKVTGQDIPDLPPLQPRLDQRYKTAGQPAGPLAAQSANAIMRFAEAHYRRWRRACIWDYRRGLPLKKFPAPFPCHNQAWKIIGDGAGGMYQQRPAISFRLHGENDGPRWLVRLASGHHYRHQLANFRWLLANGGDERDSKKCPCRAQLDLYTQPTGQQERGNTRNGRKGRCRSGFVVHDRFTSDSQRIPCLLMAKLVAYFPRPEKREATGELTLVTHRDLFLHATHEDRSVAHPWVLNEDQTLRWFAEMRDVHQGHRNFLDRFSQDQKLERRTHLGQRGQMNDARRKRCTKHDRRLTTWIKQVVAQVIGYCRRCRIAGVVYDDTDRSWLCEFPWSALRNWLRTQCLANGIEPHGTLEHAGDVTEEQLALDVASGDVFDDD